VHHQHAPSAPVSPPSAMQPNCLSASSVDMLASSFGVYAPFLLQDLLRQLAHFSSFGASRGHVPSFLAASLRFIGAKRPFAPRRGHLRTAQLRTVTE
jgi:hypothetical protein